MVTAACFCSITILTIICSPSDLSPFPFVDATDNSNVLQQTACLVVNPITVGNFTFLLNCMPVGRPSDSMTVRFKDLSFDELVGAWCFGCCQAHQGLPVGFILLRYSVLFTVESLSLLYLLLISRFMCSWGDALIS